VAKNPQRSSAGPTDPARCKLSIIADATAKLSLSLPTQKLLPYDEHFHPTMRGGLNLPELKKPKSKEIGHTMVGANILPHEEQVITAAMLEKWDFCLRRLFVLKKQSLKAAIGYGRCLSCL
jgi:mitochondrial transcription factor 1